MDIYWVGLSAWSKQAPRHPPPPLPPPHPPSTRHLNFSFCYTLHTVTLCPGAEFVDVIGTKVLRVFLLAIQSPLLTDFTPSLPPLMSKSGLKLVCNKIIVNRNLKSENSQVYAQKPQQNCTFTNSASVFCNLPAIGWIILEESLVLLLSS